MKKKLWILGIAVALLLSAVCAYVVSQPRYVFAEDAGWEIYSVEVYENGGKKDITQDVKNPELLAESLRLMECSRLRTGFAPYATKDVRYEISGMCAGQPLRLLLSDDPKLCVVYEDGSKGGWRIHRAESVLAIVELMCTM